MIDKQMRVDGCIYVHYTHIYKYMYTCMDDSVYIMFKNRQHLQMIIEGRILVSSVGDGVD